MLLLYSILDTFQGLQGGNGRAGQLPRLLWHLDGCSHRSGAGCPIAMTGIMQPRDLEWQRQPVIEGFRSWRGSLGVPHRDFTGRCYQEVTCGMNRSNDSQQTPTWRTLVRTKAGCPSSQWRDWHLTAHQKQGSWKMIWKMYFWKMPLISQDAVFWEQYNSSSADDPFCVGFSQSLAICGASIKISHSIYSN